MQRLLVSVRGKNEALEAVRGGAHIVDAEYPASALGTPYPLNIWAIRHAVPSRVLVSTNIGEEQPRGSTAAQAALGVARAGADIVKVGMAKASKKDVQLLTNRVTRTIKYWYPRKKVIPAFFADTRLRRIFDPFASVKWLAQIDEIDGILVDTFNKRVGKGLLDYVNIRAIRRFVRDCHKAKLEVLIAGSIKATQIEELWGTGVDVICVRGAACGKVSDRSGNVRADLVSKLVPK
jgi:uncharacterized protein (UPF0264 family)